MKNFFSKTIRGLLTALLGSLTLILSGCYAPATDAMYAPLKGVKTLNGKVTSSSTDNPLKDAEVKATHIADGKTCTHRKVTGDSGEYSIIFTCFDPETPEITISVTLENFEDAQQNFSFEKGNYEREQKTIDFNLEEKQ